MMYTKMTSDAENAIKEHESRTGWGFYLAAVAVCGLWGLSISIFGNFVIVCITPTEYSNFLSSVPGTYFRWLEIAALEYGLCSRVPLLSTIIVIVFCVLLFRAANHTLDISIVKRPVAIIKFLIGMVVLYFTFGRYLQFFDVTRIELFFGQDVILFVLETLLAGLIVALLSVDGPTGDLRKNGFRIGMSWGKAVKYFIASSVVCFLVAIAYSKTLQILAPYYHAGIKLNKLGDFFGIANILMYAFLSFAYALILVLLLNWLLTPRESWRRTRAKYFAFAAILVLVSGFITQLIYYAPKLNAFKNCHNGVVKFGQDLNIPNFPESDYVKIEFNGDQTTVGEYEGKFEMISNSFAESDGRYSEEDFEIIRVDYALSDEYAHRIFEVLKSGECVSRNLQFNLWHYAYIASGIIWNMELFRKIAIKCIDVHTNAASCFWSNSWLVHAPKTPTAERIARDVYGKVREYPLPNGVLFAAETCKHLGCEDLEQWLALLEKIAAADSTVDLERLKSFRNSKAPNIFDGTIKGKIIVDNLPDGMGPVHVGIGYCDEHMEKHACTLGLWNFQLIDAITPGPDGEFEFTNLTDDQEYFLAVGIRKDHGVETPMEAWEFENAPTIIEFPLPRPVDDFRLLSSLLSPTAFIEFYSELLVADLGEIEIHFNP